MNKVGSELKFRVLWLSIGYALVGLVIILSLVSAPADMKMNIPFEDKVYHAFAYFTLMVWFSQIYHDRFRRGVLALLFIFMGILLEYLQSFDPSRFAEYGDMIANASGVASGYALTLTAARNYLLRIERLLF
jgi:VanZ family protein